jgi:hypothetical protein
LPEESSKAVEEILGDLVALRNDDLITAEEFDRTQRCLEDVQVSTPGDYIRRKTSLRMIRVLSVAVDTGQMSAEQFEHEKAQYLQTFCRTTKSPAEREEAGG